jgi:hypothetical protein
MGYEKRKPSAATDGKQRVQERTRRPTSLYPNGCMVNREQSLPVYTVDGKIGGFVRGEVLRKVVRGSSHMLRKPPAWALDAEVLDTAERIGAKVVLVVDSERGHEYRATISTIRRMGRVINRGFGAQWALPIRCWTRGDELVVEQLTLGI